MARPVHGACTSRSRANKRRTFVILFGFVGLIALVGVAVDRVARRRRRGSSSIIVVIAIGLASGSYYNSDKVALAASRAKPADETEYRRYHNLVEGLCIAAGLPKPRLYVVDDPAPNAFATGRNPKHAALAVTTGLLDDDEPGRARRRARARAVAREELRHPRHHHRGDCVGAIALIADIGLRFAFWGGISGNRRDNNDSGPASVRSSHRSRSRC